MEVQPSLVLLQKTLLNIEGLGRQLYPQLDLWSTAMPFLERWVRDRYSPQSMLKRVSHRLPGWLEQLPHLPETLLERGVPGKHNSAADELRHKNEVGLIIREQASRARNQRIAIIALISAALIADPGIRDGLRHLPDSSIVLFGIALYFFIRSR
jgi:ubiquinone biosynthesis protein